MSSCLKKISLLIVSIQLLAASVSAQTISCNMLLSQNLPNNNIIRTGPFHLEPISSYNDVLAALIRDPYTPGNLPTIEIVNFDFSKMTFDVGNRSRDILKERRVILSEYRRKPIHPMGIPIKGKFVIFEPSNTNYTGVFRGGEFDVLGRFSLSQGNPYRHEPRTRRQIRRNQPAIPQVRSMTMGLLVFDPNVPKDQTSPIVSLVLQDDLNGVVNEQTGQANYFLERAVTNQPVFDPGKLLTKEARLYHFGTLAGVFFGALQNNFEKPEAEGKGPASKTLGVDPLLRPPHGLANFGETDPNSVRPPVWIKFQPRVAHEDISKRDDFRMEIYETLYKGPIVYDILAAHIIDAFGEPIWSPIGYFEVEEAFFPSRGADEGIVVPHADTTNINYFTGRSIYEFIEESE